jgi:hypothetical protein
MISAARDNFVKPIGPYVFFGQIALFAAEDATARLLLSMIG